MRITTIAAVFVSGCLFTPIAARAQDKATIQSLNDKFAAAFNSGDFAAVASHYTEDAVLLPPGAAMAKGRSAIQSFWKGAAEGVSDLKLTAIDVKSLGTEAAREIGSFTLTTKGQQTQEVAGKYVVVWQKVGNEWKLATDIWNTNK